MKILKIEFRNINSLKGTHQIDFTAAPFTVSSLFAITGPTGSGKSTILDVISLALFNQVPRLGKITKNEILSKGAILTRNQKEAFAKITYESQYGIYTSQWSISTNRNDKLRDYEMELVDLSTEKPLDLKKSDVPAKNEHLIGLNYDQFIKSVLLAQGEFAQFLKARKDERGELLEKITGTGIYRQVGIKAYQKFREENLDLLDRQREIEIITRELLEEEDLQKFSRDLSDKDKGCVPIEKEISNLEKQLQLKKAISDQEHQIIENQKKREFAEASLKEFATEHGQRLEQHERMQVHAADLRNWSRLSESCQELEAELKASRRKADLNRDELQSCHKDINTFTGKHTKAEDAEKALQEFSQKIRHLQQQKEEKIGQYKNLQQLFQTEIREVGFQLNGNLKESHEKLQELSLSSKMKIDRYTEYLNGIDLENCGTEKQRLQKELEKARKAARQAERLEKLSEDISGLSEEEQKINPILEELPRKIKEVEGRLALLRERQEKLQFRQQNELLKASLEQHRSGLKDGEPCPLCGSQDHPYASHQPPEETGLREAIRKNEQELNTENQLFSEERASLKHYGARLQEVLLKKKQLQQEFSPAKEEFDKTYKDLSRGITDWNELCEKQEEQIERLDLYSGEHRKLSAIAAGLPILNELQLVLEEGKELKRVLDTLYSGKDIHADTHRLQRRWTSLQQEQKNLFEAKKNLEQKLSERNAELSSLQENLKKKVLEAGCPEISEAFKRVLPEHEYASLRSHRESLSSNLGKITASLQTLESQLNQLKEKDVEESAAWLTTTLGQNKSILIKLRGECEELRRTLNNDKERREKISGIREQIAGKEKQIKRWRLLNELIGDATGKKFNDFAQDLSLTQLLYLANIRLKDLSDRYRMDKPSPEEDDGLVAIDEHMGGQRRSVKTLSGGETFILSLSMALALSDLASKNVEINSLFIDEGFGTLDPETLDQTLDTLEKLQAESSKTIGIISHVDSLKERIATQIRLTRNGQGYSSLEISK